MLSLTLAACQNNSKSIDPEPPTSEKKQAVTSFEDPVILSEQSTAVPTGGMCGGADKRTCERGNICVFDDQDPMGQGVCDALVIDAQQTCPSTQAPVCGLRKGQKHGFLNTCYLEKHGAELVADGLCKPVDVAGSCSAKAVGIGTCFTTVEAYEFDGTTCQKKYITGCAAEVPFATLAECESACQ